MSTLYPDLNLTVFPSGVDTFQQWLNITATDGPLIKQYMEAMEAGNTTLANQILSQIPSGTQKIIKANDLNKMVQALLAVERFYGTDVEDYIADKQQEWTDIIDQFTYQGNWNNGTAYLKNNMVSYTIYGIKYIYIAISNVPIGTIPTNTQYWRIITIQGQRGISGAGLSYRQEWNVSSLYNTNDAVTYSGALWMAINNSQGQEPVSGSSYWKLIMSLATTTYPIQDTQPTNQIPGELWFNTQSNPTKYYYLTPLDSPASASDIASGKQAYDSEGNIITGTA